MLQPGVVAVWRVEHINAAEVENTYLGSSESNSKITRSVWSGI